MRNDPIASLTFLNPIPQRLWGAHCVKCDRMQARWGITVGRLTPMLICAGCVLYESDWGKSQSPLVTSAIAAIERNSDRRFVFVDGRLSCKDADDVLGVVILTERTVARIPTSRR